MTWLTTLAAIAAKFLGRLLAAMLPAIGRELRANNTIEQKGYDDETNEILGTDIWTTASNDDCYAGCDAMQQRLQPDLHADD